MIGRIVVIVVIFVILSHPSIWRHYVNRWVP